MCIRDRFRSPIPGQLKFLDYPEVMGAAGNWKRNHKGALQRPRTTGDRIWGHVFCGLTAPSTTSLIQEVFRTFFKLSKRRWSNSILSMKPLRGPRVSWAAQFGENLFLEGLDIRCSAAPCATGSAACDFPPSNVRNEFF